MSNLALRFQQFETSLEELLTRWSSLSKSVAALQDEVATLRTQTGTRLDRVEHAVNDLKVGMSEMAVLLDAGVPQSQSQPEAKTKLPLIYTKDNETLILARPGTKESVESQGYSIIGTCSQDQQTFFKLRFTGKKT